MFLKRITHSLVAVAALLLSIGGGTNAFGVTFDLNKNQPFGNSWNTAADWTPDSGPVVVPGAGDTANTGTFLLRTPTGSNTFAATLNITSTVLLKTTGTATIADGHLMGGSLSQGIAPNSTGSFGGNIAVDANSSINLNSTATDIRTMILSASLSGSGDLNVDGGNGAAGAVGTLRLTGNNSAYTGAFNLSDQALLQVRGSALAIGVNNSNGFEASGGPVSFGTGGETMDVGRNTIANTSNIVSTVDLTGATSVQIDLATLRIGTSTANPGAQAAGILRLSQAGNNVINAGTIVIADSPGAGNTTNDSLLSLGGGLNTIDTTTMTIGGRKSDGSVSFGTPGGVLNLGSAGDRVNELRIGFNNTNTGSNTVGSFDGTGGTVNAFVNSLTLGQHNAGNGSGKGTLTHEAGTFDVTTVLLGNSDAGGSSANDANTVGTLNLNGGTFKAGSIEQGNGTAVVNFNGGVLVVDSFKLDMDQQGGTLAPGMDMMIGSTNIDGDYGQQAGTLSIDVDGIPGNNDVVNVSGDATLNGILKLVALNGFTPLVGTFDVLFATSIDLGDNFGVDISMFNNRGASAVVIDDGNGGQILRVQLVPEPTTGLLAVFGFGALAARRRRRAA